MATDTDTATQPATTDAGHDHHPDHLEHHFVSSEQQFDSAKLGMWLFLITEVLLFSGMFVAYAVYRQWHPEAFAEASSTLNVTMGTINTVVLLTSSLTVALSIHYIQMDKVKKCIYSLLATIGLAGGFMVIKYFEYMAKFSHGVYPGGLFEPHGAKYEYLAQIPYVPQFFSIYFVMTGIHGAHVVIGMAVIAWVAYRAWRGGFSSEYYTPVELTGLYWHLVDIVWIFLFPMLYLI
jgi:cytochrome c oxidase subunit 3